MKDIGEKFLDSLGIICREFREKLDKAKTDSEGYDLDENGNRLSCCGDMLEPDSDLCPTCLEHC